ncbi:Uncharacterized membrane protein [Catalinimonas alkaloidigena]|uniref:Uncharacterized membrane protein n=1 Tax=Catalinimonas alkaloidigena TaxID=1075417 RepID=A0A1G9QFB4_9BACT|nr:DUF4126 family protein [Catalinimonas alkaloidigena]SDM09784.1 Uncharacterized membrane protein [Catalinimonas alkaloidigena]
MSILKNKLLRQTLSLGFISGLRSFSGLALISQHVSAHTSEPAPEIPLTWFQKEGVAWTLTALAVGELIGDKMPGVPNRTDPPALFGRVALGAMTGAVLSQYEKEEATVGAVLGGVAALAGTFVGFYVRKALVEKSGWPDWIFAVAEDAITVGMGVNALSGLKKYA